MRRPLLPALLSIAAATAQQPERVRLQTGREPRSPLLRAVTELTMPARQRDAMQALWAAGAPAVPLLSAEVERGGAGAPAALSVLERLGGLAAPAAPVLRRAAEAAADAGWRARIEAVLARVDGPPTVLVPLFMGGAVVEFDLDGNERRRVPCGGSAWGAWPLPGDRVAVLDFQQGNIRDMTWAGAQEASHHVFEMLGSVRVLDDGDFVFTSWKEDGGMLARRSPDGTLRWKLAMSAIRIDRHFGDELFVLTRKDPQLRSFTAAGEPLRAVELPLLCHAFQLLPGGGVLLAGAGGGLVELDPDGKTVAQTKHDRKLNDVFRLRDGRTVVAGDQGVAMLGADGGVLWEHALGYCGPVFVREPADGGR